MQNIGQGPDQLTQVRAAIAAQDPSQVSEKTGQDEANAKTLAQDLQTDGRDDIASKLASKQATLAKRAAEMQKVRKPEKTDKPKALRPKEKIDAALEGFGKRNPSLKKEGLLKLSDDIRGKSIDEILELVKAEYHNVPENVFQALEALMSIEDNPETHTTLSAALNEYEGVNRAAIERGVYVLDACRKQEGVEFIRDIYRNIEQQPDRIEFIRQAIAKIVENPSDSFIDKFFKISFVDIGTEITKLNSPKKRNEFRGELRPQLEAIMVETKKLQDTKGVLMVFKNSMRRVNLGFKNSIKPPQLTYINMAKEFMSVVAERYPSSDKVLQSSEKLGVKSIEEKINVISIYRDTVREIAPRIYRSVQHRDEVFTAIIETLEDLEDQLDAASAKEEDDEEIHLPEKRDS